MCFCYNIVIRTWNQQAFSIFQFQVASQIRCIFLKNLNWGPAYSDAVYHIADISITLSDYNIK